MNSNTFKVALKRFYKKYIYTTALYRVDLEKQIPKTKRALLIYSNTATKNYLSDQSKNNSLLSTHNGFWESIQLVRSLNQFGYTVDYLNYDEQYDIDFSLYQLVIDSADNLGKIPQHLRKKIICVYYSTSAHWLYFRQSELIRVKSFYDRENILIQPERSVTVFSADIHADYITSFGNDFIKNTFLDVKKKFFNLDISVSHEPNLTTLPKKDKNTFIWFGGYGPIHKGLDITIAAFEKMPNQILHIIGDIKNPALIQWIKEKTKAHPNIIFNGWMDVSSKAFNDLAMRSVATVFPSSSEGGPGSIAQLLHFGIIPVVTNSAGVRGANLGYEIVSEDPEIIIMDIIKHVKHINETTDSEIIEKSKACIEYAKQFHTKKAYETSLNSFLKYIHS